jgi:hypothetical protein
MAQLSWMIKEGDGDREFLRAGKWPEGGIDGAPEVELGQLGMAYYDLVISCS